jgi:hypothetical protein
MNLPCSAGWENGYGKVPRDIGVGRGRGVGVGRIGVGLGLHGTIAGTKRGSRGMGFALGMAWRLGDNIGIASLGSMTR